jgi:dipeptidyl aminopeptidase/acylaminoacyl peptidase
LVPASDRKKAIVLLHGWGGNRKQMLRRARFFRDQGYTALLFDARACGESTGDAVTFGYREKADLVAAVKFLKDRGHADIACLGVSQGGATICFAADELNGVKCVICESVYDEMTHALDRRMRSYTGMPGWLGGLALVPFAERQLELNIDEVRPIDYVGKLPCPVLVISGEKDDRAWPADTRRLFNAAREPKKLWMVPEARHEDLFRFAGYEDKIQAFLRKHVP